MKLAVGFITYNETSAKYLADFLPSLSAALRFLRSDDYQVYVFDNSPTVGEQGSADKQNFLSIESFNSGLSASGRPPFKYLSVGANLGFSRAYNILINLARSENAEYFFMVNPDTLLEEKTISELIKILDNDASLGSVAPKIRRWDFAGREKTAVIDSLGLVLRPGLIFSDLGQGIIDSGQFDHVSIIGPTGAAGLFRLNALINIAAETVDGQETQYFDERFFMYKEDCDLAYRLFLAGYKSVSVPGAILYHDRTAKSSGRNLWSILRDRQGKDRQIRSWSFRNQHLIFAKYWKIQNIVNKLFIVYYIGSYLIFSLILEQFLLKQYYYILKFSKGLTNIK